MREISIIEIKYIYPYNLKFIYKFVIQSFKLSFLLNNEKNKTNSTLIYTVELNIEMFRKTTFKTMQNDSLSY